MNSRQLQTDISRDVTTTRNGANADRLILSFGNQPETYEQPENALGDKGHAIHRLRLSYGTIPTELVVLNSWKEIAAHLGRGIRTVQRWESELGLPVHRPRGKNRSAVVACQAELDHWLRCTPLRPNGDTNRDIGNALLQIARDLQRVGEELIVRADRQTRPEARRLVNAALAIGDELISLTNSQTGRRDCHKSQSVGKG